MPATAAAQLRITRLAGLIAVHRAFHWLHLHQPQLRQWQLEIVRIPAPPFGESARAAHFLGLFQRLGLTNIHIDDAGNVLGELAPSASSLSQSEDKQGRHSERSEEPQPFSSPANNPPSAPSTPLNPSLSQKSAVDKSVESKSQTPVILISAHLDTVFPADTPIRTVEDPDSTRIHAPGICDNAAGLTALLAIIAALRYAQITPPIPILFAANVGEEGEGDLRGMRHLFERGPYRNRIAAAMALEGSGTNTVVTRALGSLRFRVTITGPGGHSWADASAPNPILILSQALAALTHLELPPNHTTTLNVGHISGGTSVNSIPESASALIDLRSTDPTHLISTAIAIRSLFEETVYAATPRKTGLYAPPGLHIETIGNRPAATLPDDSPILHTVRAVDRHLTLRTEQRLGSTDANIPLSRNIPAIAIGAGGTGGGIHTQQEWYDPTGRETALRRILLTLLDITQTTAESHPHL